MTTDAEHATVLRRHYGPTVLAPNDLRAAIERSIEMLERGQATVVFEVPDRPFVDPGPNPQASFRSSPPPPGIPWPGTAAESNAAIRVSWASGRSMTDQERQALLETTEDMVREHMDRGDS